MKIRLIKSHTCEYILATDIIPEPLGHVLWPIIAEDGAFDWGNNDLTLVYATRLAACIDNNRDCILLQADITKKELDGLVRRIRKLGDVLVNIESPMEE